MNPENMMILTILIVLVYAKVWLVKDKCNDMHEDIEQIKAKLGLPRNEP